MSIRGQLALGLLIAELFSKYADLSGEDKEISQKGIAMSWQWIEGKSVDPYDLCEYIDGETNLPYRSTKHERGSRANDVITSAWLIIGLIAFNACEEAEEIPSESVENFGDNEWNMLYDLSSKLDPADTQAIKSAEDKLVELTKSDQSKFGKPLNKPRLKN